MNSIGYEIKNGTNVNVFNEKDTMLKRRNPNQPGSHRVIGKYGSLYVVINEQTGEKQLVPRYKLCLK